MAERMQCAIEECRKIFLELSLFWRLSLVGFVLLLGMGCSVFTWAHSCYKEDLQVVNNRLNAIEAAFNDISFVRAQSNEILDNQRKILKLFEDNEALISRRLSRKQ